MGRLTYTTQEVQDRLDAAGSMVRPNLLDNAYFVGGGSQQGSGKFPINQRGNSTYNSHAQYSLDRWMLRNSGSTSVTLNSDGLRFVAGGAGLDGLNQPLENKDQYAGVVLRVSVLVKNVSFSSGTTFRFGVYSANSVQLHSYAHGYANITGDGLYSAIVTVDPTQLANYNYLNIGLYASSTAVSATVVAVKAEVGKQQTLGHMENGEWMLNTVPNFQQELARCQRFFFSADSIGTIYCNYDIGIADTTTTSSHYFKLPVPMRTIPTLAYTGTWGLTGGSGLSSQTVTGITMGGDNVQAGGSTVAVKVTVGSGLTVGQSYILQKRNSASGTLWLSADL